MTDLTTQIADIIRRTLNDCGYNDKDVPPTAAHVAAVLVAELQLQQETIELTELERDAARDRYLTLDALAAVNGFPKTRIALNSAQVVDELIAAINRTRRRTNPEEFTETRTGATTVCEGFQWVGQSFVSCEGCGQPYWEHDFDQQIKRGSGPFDDDPWELVPITAEMKAAVKARWDR